MGLRDLLTAPPVTPPAVVRLGLLTAYCYAWQVGLRTQAACVAAAWGAWFGGAATGGDGLLLPASVAYDAQHGICLLTAIYALDAALAACPLHWCCMRSIPPKNVLEHHVPFVIGMLPTVTLSLFFADDFRDCLLATPTGISYTAAGCLTSFNEALWIASSFFPEALLESQAYRVGQKLAALGALSQFIGVGGASAGAACASLVAHMASGAAPELVAVRAAFLCPCAAFFAIVPFVQIPLLRGAWARFIDALNSSGGRRKTPPNSPKKAA